MNKKLSSRFLSTVSALTIGCSWSLGALPPTAALAQEAPTESAQEDQIVPVIVKLKGDAVLATEQASGMGAEFIETPQAEKLSSVIGKAQDRAVSALRELYPELEVGFRYSLVFNGFSCELPESLIEEAKSISFIEDICPSCKYSAPKPMMTSSGGAAYAPQFEEITGASGEGELIAVIDSELNTAHSMFMAIDQLQNKLSKSDIQALAKDNKFTADIDPDKAYLSSKLPFIYDYTDDTPYDVTDEDIYHGTHVAGIAAGNRTATPKGDPISGIAPDAQIAFMKIFEKEEYGEGLFDSYCTDETIAAALEDAVALKADVINMSLGSPSEGIEDLVYAQIIEAVDNAGIVLCAAAGNEGESYLGPDGPNITANVDLGTLNEPAIFPTVFSVASADNTKIEVYHFTAGGETFSYVDGSSEHPCFELAGDKYEAVYVGNAEGSEIGSLDLTGKIALCGSGGELSYEEKSNNAANAGAAAIIICDSYYSPRMAVTNGEAPIPMAYVMYEESQKLMAMSDIWVTFSDEEAELEDLPREVSYFSSSGVSSSLSIDPEIMGIGGDVLSASYYDGYEKMGGTSMATPFVAGCVAVADQYLKQQGIDLTGSEKTAYIKDLLMNSASPYSSDGEFVSPRRQGAGLVDLGGLLEDTVIARGSGGRAKVELGDKVGDKFSFDIELKNISDKTVDLGTPYLYLSTDDYYHNDDIDEYCILGERSADFTMSQTDLAPIPAKGSAKVHFDVELDPDFVKEYGSMFPNGYFIEGYVYFVPNENCCPISIPLLGFHGDWAAVPIFDDGLLASSELGVYAGENELLTEYPLGETVLLLDQLIDYESVTDEGQFSYYQALMQIMDDQEKSDKLSALGDGMVYISPNEDQIADILAYSYVPLRQARFSEVMIYNEEGELLTEYDPSWQISHISMVSSPKLDLSQLPEGKYTAEISAYIDYPGAEENKQTIRREFTVDRTAPEVSSSIEEKDGRKLLTVTASDPHLDAFYINALDPSQDTMTIEGLERSFQTAASWLQGENSFLFHDPNYNKLYEQECMITNYLSNSFDSDIYTYNFMDVVLPEYDSDGNASITYDITDFSEYQISILDRAMNAVVVYSQVSPETALREGSWWGTSETTDRYLFTGEGYGCCITDQSDGVEHFIDMSYDGTTLTYTDDKGDTYSAQITWKNKDCFTALWEDGNSEEFKFQSYGPMDYNSFFSNEELIRLTKEYENDVFGQAPAYGEAKRSTGSDIEVRLYDEDDEGNIYNESLYLIDRFTGTFYDGYGSEICLSDYDPIQPGVWGGSTNYEDYCAVRFYYFSEDGSGKRVDQTDKSEQPFTYDVSGKNITFTFEDGSQETYERTSPAKGCIYLGDALVDENCEFLYYYSDDSDSFTFYSNIELAELCYDHYEARNGQRPEQSTARNISSSEVEISLYDGQGELLDVYTVSMLYADGFNSANDYIILTDPSWVEVKYGDVDGDGSIDSTDASQVLVIYAANQTGEPMELTDRESSAADINMDGFIDASDASTILAYYSYTQTGGTKDIFEFIYTIM
ncbi:MAG: S8 family serine peptidase [Ruminococcus sp.]|nr:S8 family serine peptidase [Ruminococcus sp.]